MSPRKPREPNAPAPPIPFDFSRVRAAPSGRKPRRLRKRVPRAVPPDGIARRYGRKLRLAVRRILPAIVESVILARLPILLPNPPEHHDAPRATGRLVGHDIGGLSVAWERLTPAVEQAAQLAFAFTADHQREQWARQVREVAGVDVVASEPWLVPEIDRKVRENVQLARSIPERYIDRVADVVRKGAAEGLRHEEIAQQIAAQFTADDAPELAKAGRRAELLARDQVAKFNASVGERRQKDLGVTRYRWRTVQDERVRPEHRDRDGEIFEWSSPPSDGHPGEPPLCRCLAEPVLEDVLDDL